MFARDDAYREKALKHFQDALQTLDLKHALQTLDLKRFPEYRGKESSLEHQAKNSLTIALGLMTQINGANFNDKDKRFASECYFTLALKVKCTRENYKKAISLLKKIKEKNRKDYQTLAKYYEKFGLNYYCNANESIARQKQYTKGIATLKRLAKHHEANDSCLRQLANLYKMAGNYEAAIATLGKIQSPQIDDYINTSECFLNIGDLHVKEKHFAQGLQAYSNAITVLTAQNSAHSKVVLTLQEASYKKLTCFDEHKKEIKKTKADNTKSLALTLSSDPTNISTQGFQQHSLFAKKAVENSSAPNPSPTLTL